VTLGSVRDVQKAVAMNVVGSSSGLVEPTSLLNLKVNGLPKIAGFGSAMNACKSCR
jgi:hypothetical protein